MGSTPHESRIYYALSRFYETFFSPFFRQRIHDTIRSLNIPAGAKVLELGVGTGLSLEAYPPHADVTAIDLSPEMLRQAQEKIDKHGWQHIRLREGNALAVDLPDSSFDYVMAFHIASVVPDASQFVREIHRLAKPGGTIVIINHLRSPRPWIARGVDLLGPITHRLGWHTKLTYEHLLAAAPLEPVRRYKTSPRSLFTVVIARKPLEVAGDGNEKQNGEDRIEGAEHLNVHSFIDRQLKIVADVGIHEYLPALWVTTPKNLFVSVLVDPPEDEELEPLAREWALHTAGKHDYLLAFRADDAHLKVVVGVGAELKERIVAVS